VLFAPVTLLLKVRRELCAALGTNVFRNAMFDAPVSVEVVPGLSMIVIALVRNSFRFGIGTTLVATAGNQHHHRDSGERQTTHP
jgi:hypothetical protein